jgi:eukaryotic-like serine/threonine-protein kinase
VAPFPNGGRRRVSNAGGVLPRWKADGRELYYISTTGDVMAVAFTGTDPIEPALPAPLFRACGSDDHPAAAPGPWWYDVTADASRFLMICTVASANSRVVTVSVDWTAALK